MPNTLFPRREYLHLLGFLSLAVGAWQWLPDRYLGPYDAWNPHAIAEFVVAIFAISLLGKFLIHWLGNHYGVLLSGFVGGFASSTATIHTLGVLARQHPQHLHRAALAAVLSNIPTLIQLLVVARLVAPELLAPMVRPMGMGVAAMLVYVAWTLHRVSSAQEADGVDEAGQAEVGHTAEESDAPTFNDKFNWRGLVILTGVVCAVSWMSAALHSAYGQDGVILGAALSGFSDAHAMLPSLAVLMQHGQLSAADALLPVYVALSTNALTKSVIALQSGGWPYAQKVLLGIWITLMGVWLGLLI